MNYEQKYKDALERAKKWHNAPNADKIPTLSTRIIEEIFPELCESEDERIRKAIYIYLDWLDGRRDYQPKGEYTIKDMIAWLEKQGQVKESFISQHEIETCKENDDSLTSEDERMIRIIENAICTNEAQELVKTKYGLELTDLADWLEKRGEKKPTDEEMKELLRTEYEKGRADAIAETQVAWSEEDKVMLDEIIDFFENGTVKLQHDLSLYASWLKSLLTK